MKMRRKFNGKEYYHYGNYRHKYAAGQAAKNLRRKGKLARVVKSSSNMWAVYEK